MPWVIPECLKIQEQPFCHFRNLIDDMPALGVGFYKDGDL